MLRVLESKSSAAVGRGSGMAARKTPSCGSGPIGGLVTFAAMAQRPSGMTCARRPAGVHKPAPSGGSPRKSDPRPGRRRARLYALLPALALLLGALSLFSAAPAQAQTAATISASPATVTEGQPVTITVTLPSPWVGGLPGFSSGSQGVCNARRSQATLERCRDDGSATRDVVVFLTLTHNTSEDGDFNARPRSSVLIRRGQRTGTWVLHTLYDTDKDNETFTVSLASTQLSGFLNPITSGSPSSVQITITDDYPSADGDLSKILIGNR